MIEYLRTNDEIFALTLTAHHDAQTASYSVLDLDTSELVQSGSMTLTASTNNQTSTWSASMTTASGAAYDRNVKITYNIKYPTTSSTVTSYSTIVRPFATPTRIRALADIDASVSDATLLKTEKKARLFIQAHTDFLFLKQYQSTVVYGNNSDILTLQYPVIRIDYIYEDDILMYDAVSTASFNKFDYNLEPAVSKWRIKAIGSDNSSSAKTISDDRAVLEYPDISVIPYDGIFKKDYAYKIVGVFGYSYVPNEIEQATALLVEDYLCNDWNLRNKNIQSMKNDSYQVQYSKDFASGTGNLMVDSLLSKWTQSITPLAV